jgi:hypothetical protein
LSPLPKRTAASPKGTQTYIGPVADPVLRAALPYVPFRLSQPTTQVPGFLTRLSSRWYRHWETKVLPLPIPYIDHVGKFTIHQLGSWWMTPEQWFASVAATVNDRLFRLYCRRNQYRYVTRHVRDLLTRAAVFYSATHNNYIFDRLLANLRPNRLKVFEKILYYVVCRLGANFRFVYSQTCLQVSWLQFRSKWIRDKSRESLEMLSTLFLSVRTGRRKKHRFVGANPFIFTLNYLRVWKDGNAID